MANLNKVPVIWSGVPVVGGGVSTFYFNGVHTGFLADLSAFFTSVGAYIAGGVTFSFPSSGDLIDDVTGALTGTWTEPSQPSVASSGIGQFANGVGTRVVWPTSGVTNNRRVKGSTFLVPLTVGVYTGSGHLDDTIRGNIDTAATALFSASAGEMVIWTRPVAGAGGQSSTVIGADVPDQVSWLRSRRT